jgi:hypothetical protein
MRFIYGNQKVRQNTEIVLKERWSDLDMSLGVICLFKPAGQHTLFVLGLLRRSSGWVLGSQQAFELNVKETVHGLEVLRGRWEAKQGPEMEWFLAHRLVRRVIENCNKYINKFVIGLTVLKIKEAPEIGSI